MFFKGLKEKSILKAITKANNLRELSQESNQIKSVGFIVDTSDFNLSEADLEQIAKSIGATLEASVKFTKTHKKTNADEGLIAPKQIGWKGVFKTQELKDFQTKNFDVLITLSQTENLYISALNTLTQAKFKVSVSSNYENFNDLNLNLPKFDLSIFISELKKYLTILNKV